VELWPLVPPAEVSPPEPWAPPVVERNADDPGARLAAAIAQRVRRWIDSGERLESAGRPIQAGDVMVLVRQRTDFMQKLVDAFKAARVPVAGVDRMKLTDQLAVQDLMALGRFALLPEDDLTLAVVLKGPLVGFDDDALFALAWNRGGRGLWATLVARAGDTPGFGAAHVLLADLLAGADYVTPFAFYADILGRRRGREKILARLGLEAVDPIGEFLALALAYERSNPPSLQGFLHWIETRDAEIKRELEQTGRDEVRVITVHGAKGLEAPIVFLPDTLSKPQARASLFWLDHEAHAEPAFVLWSSAKALDDPVAAAARAAAAARMEQEYHRLLYVALTRARDRLYLCGATVARTPPEGCWYSLVASALERLGEAFEFTADVGPRGWTGAGFRYATRPTGAALPSASPPEATASLPPLPDWAIRTAPDDGAPVRPRAPSRAGADATPLRAPVGEDHGALYRRGTLIHRLLQILPTLPPERRAAAAAHFLAAKLHRLSPEAQAAYAAETLAVIADPRFAAVFGAGSAAEVPIVGTIEGVPFVGQIDRMRVGESEVLVVDYKTNRPPPVEIARVPRPYLRQLAAYRALVMRVYPGRSVSCAILWTDAPRLMPIPAAALDGLLP
ncbi:MAG: double-strand break repair helicase AddA, partial [Alphaproteobacteria bacterium]|nr:double-strand break repair helicase AddA [Alphaproteobacteria bacterium]